MTPLTRCDLRRRSRMVLRPGMTLWAAVTVGVLCALSLGQVHLRFMTRDLMIETGFLQRVSSDLTNEKNRLISQVEELKRYERLREYAENELGLCKCPPSKVHKAYADAQTLARWSDAQTYVAEFGESGRAGGAGADPAARAFLATVGEKMMTWSNVALAREVSRSRN